MTHCNEYLGVGLLDKAVCCVMHHNPQCHWEGLEVLERRERWRSKMVFWFVLFCFELILGFGGDGAQLGTDIEELGRVGRHWNA